MSGRASPLPFLDYSHLPSDSPSPAHFPHSHPAGHIASGDLHSIACHTDRHLSPGLAAPESPTSTPAVYTFAVLRVSEPPPCEQRRLIRGRVFDAQGQGLGDVGVHIFNDFGYSTIFYTWVDSPAGYYEFFMGPHSGDFHLQVVDATGQPISLTVEVRYEGGCVSEVDWQRSF